MENRIELTIASRFDNVELVGSITKSITEMLEFDEDTASWIDLSIRESVINAIKHGNRLSAEKPVNIRFDLENDALVVVVRDYGEGFDLSLVPDPLDPVNLLNPNGRGIFYMKTFMDETDYSLHPDGGTIVRMVKRKVSPENKGETATNGPSDN